MSEETISEIPEVPKRRRRILIVIVILVIAIVVAAVGMGLYIQTAREGEEPSDRSIDQWLPTMVTEEKVEWFDPIGPDTRKDWKIDNIGREYPNGTISYRDTYKWKLGSGPWDPGGWGSWERIDMPSDYYFVCYPIGSPPRLVESLSPTLTTRKEIDFTPYERGEAFLDFDFAFRGLTIYGPVEVLISSDGGKTWGLPGNATFTYVYNNPPFLEGHFKVDISGYLGSTIKIRFNPKDLLGMPAEYPSAHRSAIGIDNVRVTVFPKKLSP